VTLDDLKLRIKEIPISQIIGQYLAISKKGNNQLAICPFHDDSNPSMNINDSKNMFFCFVDNIGGDAIRFVMLYKNLNFVDALKEICESQGWRYEDYVLEKKESPKFEMAKKVLSKAALIYQKIGTESEVFKAFLKDRGLSEEVATTYQLGFTPSGNTLLKYFETIKDQKTRDFALQIAFELGLIKKDKNSYDKFRDRIIFPIWDHFGQVIGFTSRATKEKQLAKYMNSTDSFIFNKKNILYGLHLAKNSIREKDSAIIVEGNMDQISLFAQGFENSVAIMGVALGDRSLTKLLNLTKNIYLCLDNDSAGFKATTRINEQFLKENIIPKYIDLAPHKDPDDFLKEEGKVELQKRIDESKSFIDVLIDLEFPEKVPEITDRKLEILHKMFEFISPMGNTLFAKERVQYIAKRLELKSDSESLSKAYENHLEANIKPTYASPPPEQRTPPPQPEDETEIPAEISHKNLAHEIFKHDRILLQEIVQNPELLLREKAAQILDNVESSEVKIFVSELKNLIYEIDDSGYENSVKAMLSSDKYSTELSAIVGGVIYQHKPIDLEDSIADKILEDLDVKINQLKLNQKRDQLRQKQKEATDETKRLQILKELVDLEKQINKNNKN